MADYAASVQGVAIRVTRLNSNGTLSTVPGHSIVTSAFIRVSFTPEYEDGDEITEKTASGQICVTYKAPDTLKRVNLEIAVCNPDPLMTQLLSGGILLTGDLDPTTAPDNVLTDDAALGWASGHVGDDPAGNGVAVEVWSRAIQSGKSAAVAPYFHWVFPYVKTRLSGDRVIENGMLATTFEGNGVGNAGFGSGPDARPATEVNSTLWRWPSATDRPYLYARAMYAPIGLNGPVDWSVTPPAVVPALPADPGAGVNVPGETAYDPTKDTDYMLAQNNTQVQAAFGSDGSLLVTNP